MTKALLYTRQEKGMYGVLLITNDGRCENRDKYGYFKCRVKSSQCDLVYTTNATRERYVSNFFLLLICDMLHNYLPFFIVNAGQSCGLSIK